MRFAARVSIAIMAVFALSIATGAGSASAKVCSTSGAGKSCAGSHGSVYTGPFTAKNIGNIVVSPFITVTCSESTISGEVTNGETGEGKITSMTFGKCSTNLANPCSAVTTASSGAPWPTSITPIPLSPPNGQMTIKGFTVTVTCTLNGSPFVCKFTAPDAGSAGEVVITGGENAELEFVGVPIGAEAGSNPVCLSPYPSIPNEFSASYSITTPSSIFIT